jgi:ribosomal protein S18 acetylase RimI-like enzyme
VGVDTAQVSVNIRQLEPDDNDAALCGLIYVRSWPETAACSYSREQIHQRLTGRTISFWTRYLDRSPTRLLGSLDGSHGFLLVSHNPGGLELSYLFVEPEAFGSGLASRLYEAALASASSRPEFAWVLSCNQRSLRFFTKRGWEQDDTASQPAWADSHRYTRLVLPATPPSTQHVLTSS